MVAIRTINGKNNGLAKFNVLILPNSFVFLSYLYQNETNFCCLCGKNRLITAHCQFGIQTKNSSPQRRKLINPYFTVIKSFAPGKFQIVLTVSAPLVNFIDGIRILFNVA